MPVYLDCSSGMAADMGMLSTTPSVSVSTSSSNMIADSGQNLKYGGPLGTDRSYLELQVLRGGLEKYVNEQGIMTYIKIVTSSLTKTVRDVAMRCQWLGGPTSTRTLSLTYYPSEGPTSTRTLSLTYYPSEALEHNGSLYAHVYFARSGYPVDPSDPEYEQKSTFGRTRPCWEIRMSLKNNHHLRPSKASRSGNSPPLPLRTMPTRSNPPMPQRQARPHPQDLGTLEDPRAPPGAGTRRHYLCGQCRRGVTRRFLGAIWAWWYLSGCSLGACFGWSRSIRPNVVPRVVEIGKCYWLILQMSYPFSSKK